MELVRSRRTNGRQGSVRIVFLPTCASEDGMETVDYWRETARARLGTLGAQVDSLPIVDPASADDPEYARLIAEAEWVYIGGGYPHVGMRILKDSRALQAIQTAHQQGALIAGASAGAMMMGSRSWVITSEMDAAVSELFSNGTGVSDFILPIPPSLDCLGLIPQVMCWPHTNQFFSLAWLKSGLMPPGHRVIGIDEQTALVTSGTNGWQVLGKGKVTLIDQDFEVQEYPPNSRLEML
jgi:cyanophycinase